MKTIFKLSSRYVKKGRARTISTFFGVVLSSFLVTTVLLVAFSIYHSMQKSNRMMYGDWHIAFTEGKIEEKEKFVNAFKSEYTGKKSLLGYSNIVAQGQNLHINIFGADDNWFKMMNVNLIKGSLPNKNGEILVSEQFYEKYCKNKICTESGELKIYNRYDFDGKLLSELTGYSESDILQYKDVLNYNIVGVYDDNNRNIGDTWSFSFYTNSSVADENSWIYIQMDNPENVFEIGESISAESCVYNLELLSSLGISDSGENSKNYIIVIAILALVIITISTMLLIANSFMTSFNERIKQVGLLLSLGMKKRQVYALTLSECILIAVLAIPIGMTISVFFTYLIVRFYGNYLAELVYATVEFEVYISLQLFIIIFIVSFFVMLLSALYPAFVSGKINIIDSIRQNNIDGLGCIKGAAKEKTIEKVIVKRNFTRYKKKYFVARLSLIISVVLLISFKLLCYYTIELIDVNELEYDIKVVSYDKSIEAYSEIYSKHISADNRISNSWWIIETNEESFAKDNFKLSEEAECFLTQNEDSDILCKYYVLDDVMFENLMLDKSRLYYYDTLYVSKIENGKCIEEKYAWLDNTSEMRLELAQNKSCSLKSLPVEATTFLQKYSGGFSGIGFVFPKSIAADMIKDFELTYSCYVVADDHKSVAENIEENTDFSVFDITKDYETQKNSMVTVELVCKGFAGFIWMFSCVNTLFTIITNISTRKKEFAIFISLGANKKHLIKIFRKECIRNFSVVCFVAYIICTAISVSLWMCLDAQQFYFPVYTAACCFVINIFLYIIAYLISFLIVRNISVVDELKIN